MSQEEPNPLKDFEFPKEFEVRKRKSNLPSKVVKKSFIGARKVAPISAVLALVISLTGVYFGYPVYRNYKDTDPAKDGYVSPRSPGDIVDRVVKGVVVINCIPNKGEPTLGSGWAINLKPLSNQYKSAIITNFHVISECIDGKGKLNVENTEGKTYEAVVDVIDPDNDLAKISTKLKVPYLDLSENAPWPGYWVMTVGAADGYQGSVTFGSVMNATMTEIFITANISHGNSGGPLVDNEGYVIGTNSWGMKGEQYNGAMSLDAMCAKILECKHANGKEFWAYS